MDNKELQDWQDWSEAYESGVEKGKEKEKEIDEEGGAGEKGTPELTANIKKIRLVKQQMFLITLLIG